MTKRVRIENADTSTYKVAVDVWDKGQDGRPDVLVETKLLLNPAELVEAYIHDGRYLVVRELT